MTPEGVIDRKTDCTFERQFGLVGHLTEGRKINANSASSEDEAANLECFIGDSGTGKNIQKQVPHTPPHSKWYTIYKHITQIYM